MRAFTDESGALNSASFPHLELLVGPKEQPLDLATARLQDADELLGLGEQGTESILRAEVVAGIRDEGWSAADLLPMLCLGSTAELPFVIRRLKDRSRPDTPILFASEVEPYARLFLGDPKFVTAVWPEGALGKVVEAARRSSAVMVADGQMDVEGRGVESFDLYGRARRRQAMVDLLSDLFADAERQRVYVRCMAACGELHALRVLREALAKDCVDADLHRFCSGLLRAILSSKETGYSRYTQRRVQAGCDSHCAHQRADTASGCV